MSDRAKTADRQGAALDKLVRRYLGSGTPAEQALRLTELLAQVDAPSQEYEQWLLCGTRIFAPGPSEVRPALLHIYLGQYERARALLPSSAVVELAFVRLWEAEACAQRDKTAPGTPLPAKVAELYVQAADALLAAQRPVQAALAYQAAGQPERAQGCWQRVLREGDGDRRLGRYQQALVRVNLSLVSFAGGAASQREAYRQAAAAQQLLEELADEAEAAGERERALDCYQVLLQLGQALGRFENIAEGYLNSIRLLKAEQLRLPALRYYEDFARIGAALGEHHTVAQLCREAADYQVGFSPALRRHYQRRAAQAAVAAAEQLKARGGAPTLCEHAYLLAIESWNALDDFVQVGACFAALAELPLPTEQQRRYAQLRGHYPQATPAAARTSEPADAALPAFLQKPQVYPPVWLLDLLEWEAAGDPAAVCLSLLGDGQRASLTRRHALLVLLLCRAAPSPTPDERTLLIVRSLANLRAYEALPPLERLFTEAAASANRPDDPGSAVRVAILATLPKLGFKRALYLVLRGLDDVNAAVQKEALMALSRLQLVDAIAPLCRLFRERSDPQLRSAVLSSLGRTHDLRAGEFLLSVLRHEPEPLRSEARRLLLRSDYPELVPLVQRCLELDSGPARPALQAVLAHLSGKGTPSAS